MSYHYRSNPRRTEDHLARQIDGQREECPRCGFKTVVAVANQKICNQCGGVFSIDASPVSTRAQKARENAVGWKPR